MFRRIAHSQDPEKLGPWEGQGEWFEDTKPQVITIV
jgi:hypothetical protein